MAASGFPSLVQYENSSDGSSQELGGDEWDSEDEHDFLGLAAAEHTVHGSPSSQRTSPAAEAAGGHNLTCAPPVDEDFGSTTDEEQQQTDETGQQPHVSPSHQPSPPTEDFSSTDEEEQTHHAEEPEQTPGPSKKYAMEFSKLPKPMKDFLEELKAYFTRPVNLERQRPPVTLSTYNKTQERLLCFLGFASMERGLEIKADLFLREQVLEDYLGYLKQERLLLSSTIANHAASLVYPAKFLHPEHSPEYAGVKVIKTLRAQVNLLQRAARGEQSSSKEELKAQNRWLDWSDIVQSVAVQRARLDLARTPVTRARESANLLLLSLYVLMPPSRGLEIRTLEILTQPLSASSPQVAARNVVHLQEDGGVTFIFQKYKTRKTYGSDTTTLQSGHELGVILREHVETHRPRLVTAQSGDFLLVD